MVGLLVYMGMDSCSLAVDQAVLVLEFWSRFHHWSHGIMRMYYNILQLTGRV